MFNTYKAKFYLDNNFNIVWLKSESINGWRLFWRETENIIDELGVWNIVKSIIENKNYSPNKHSTFIEELNIAYNSKLNRLILKKS